MNHGCMIMTWKQSSSLRNGRHHQLCDPKKRAKFTATSSECWSFFWHSRNCAQGVYSTSSDCQWKVLLWGFETTKGKCEAQTAWDVEERRLVVAPWQCSCTHLARCEGIPDKKWHDHCSPPCLLTWPGPLRFLCVPYETPVERAAFHIHLRDSSRITIGTKHAKTRRLQWVLPKMAKSLGSLYTSPRWLLRRWQWKLALKVSIHVIMSKFLEILGSTS